MTKELLKEQYALPECRVYEVHLAKVIATSGGGDNEGFPEVPGSWS